MHKLFPFVIIGVATCFGDASAESAPEIAVDALAESLAFMPAEDVLDCWMATVAVSEFLPKLKSGGDVWYKILMQRISDEALTIDELRQGSALLKSRKENIKNPEANRKVQLKVMQGCMSNMLQATDESVSKIASEYGIKDGIE